MVSEDTPPLALVTGASGGIGGPVARRLAADGHRVIVHYQSNAAGAQQVVDQIVVAGGEAFAIQADVSDYAQAQALVKEATEKYGPLRVLVNNAGITRNVLIGDMTDEDWWSVLNVNLGGVVNCTRAAVDHLRGGGSIINMSSIMSEGGWRGSAAYSASKAAINAFTRTCAIEYGRLGICVNAVLPGFVETDLVSDLVQRDGGRGIRMQLPTRQATGPDEVADLVSFLAREGNSQLTGALIPVDGGATASLLLGHPSAKRV